MAPGVLLNRLWDLVIARNPHAGPGDNASRQHWMTANTGAPPQGAPVHHARDRGHRGRLPVQYRHCPLQRTARNCAGQAKPRTRPCLRETLEIRPAGAVPDRTAFRRGTLVALGHTRGIFRCGWPQADAGVAREDQVEMPVQINGKIRTRLTFATDTDQATVQATVLADPEVQRWMQGLTVRKIIIVPNKLVNIAVS
jgi:hypothetical protein